MSKANKWVGGGRVGASGPSSKMGKTAYGAQAAAQYAHLSPSTKGGGSKDYSSSLKENNNVNMTRSSHNDINRFTAGIQKTGQYNSQPTNTDAAYKSGNTDSKSHFSTPTGSAKSKMGNKVGAKKIKPADKYNPRTPNIMKPDNQGKFLDKSQVTKGKSMSRMAKSLKK